MTLQEAKDLAAREWNDAFDFRALDNGVQVGNIKHIHLRYVTDRAMELYARSKWDEGFDTSIKKFEQAKTYAKTLVEVIQLDAVLAILDVTKKEFKP